MAVKTITIDMEAYNLLSQEKRKNESFSKVIKRTIREHQTTADTLLERLDACVLEEDTLDSIERVYESRQESMISSPPLDQVNK